MFDCIDLAMEAFGIILNQRERGTHGWHARQLGDWIRQDVMDAIDDLILRPDFRDEARWSLVTLQPDAIGPNREMVDEVDSALVGHANALMHFLRQGDVLSRFQSPDTYCGSPIAMLNSRHPAAGLGIAEFIASRPWRDLVSSQDFFGPAADLNLRPDIGVQLRPAEFVPGLVEPLRQPGDHIVDMLIRRVKYWTSDLSGLRSRAAAVAGSMEQPPECWFAVQATAARLSRSVQALEAHLAKGLSARHRRACVSLVQAYADFHPQPKLDWLQLANPTFGRGCLRMWLENHGEVLVALRIAAALCVVSTLYRSKVAPDVVLKEAARSHALVLGQGFGTRKLYWNGASIEGKWEQAALSEVMWALGCRAKQGQGLDHHHFGINKENKPVVNRHTLTSRVSRLKQSLPIELANRIDGVSSPGSYALRLPPIEIFLCEITEDGVNEITQGMGLIEVRELMQSGPKLR